jgi:transposase
MGGKESTMSEKRRQFSQEFKREAVRRAFSGDRPVAEVARELDVRPDMLRRWRRKLSGAPVGPQSEADREVTRLRRELRDVREERDILKKALAIFSDRRP